VLPYLCCVWMFVRSVALGARWPRGRYAEQARNAERGDIMHCVNMMDMTDMERERNVGRPGMPFVFLFRVFVFL
jgi:hypothetical protein